MNGVVYVAFGSHADLRPYHGWVFAYNAATLSRLAIFNTSPNGNMGAIWQSGTGLTADSAGNIYFNTGNGSFDANKGGSSLGESMVKLGPPVNGTLTVKDWFTPYNYVALNTYDLDFGSSGILNIPGTDLLLAGDKQGILYLVNADNMGHYNASDNSQIVQTFLATARHVHGAPVYWNSADLGPLIYVWSEIDFLRGFKFGNGVVLTTPFATSAMKVPGGMPGGFLSLSANGGAAGSGIVWASHPYALDATHATVNGILRAFDASNLTELWNSRQNANRDDVGDFSKMAALTVANGKVYAATFSGELVVYGLLNGSAWNGSYAVNSGGSAAGAYQADKYFTGGTTLVKTNYVEPGGVARWAPNLVYQSARTGEFTYTFPKLTPNGSYLVRLHFAELLDAAAIGTRLFNAAINNAQVLSDFDIFATAGGNYRALTRVFPATADSSGNIRIQFTTGSAGTPLCSGIEVTPVPATSATFVKADTATQGTWKGTYGSQGYRIFTPYAQYPPNTFVRRFAGEWYTWRSSTADPRALQKPNSATDRIAACTFDSTNFTMDINFNDGQMHQTALYFLDWDNNKRVQNVDVLDANTGIVLDTKTVSQFLNGTYLVWNIKGHVQIRLSRSIGPNAVLSGLFFDPID